MWEPEGEAVGSDRKNGYDGIGLGTALVRDRGVGERIEDVMDP